MTLGRIVAGLTALFLLGCSAYVFFNSRAIVDPVGGWFALMVACLYVIVAAGLLVKALSGRGR